MRILLVTQMWPGPRDSDLGAFLVPLTRELDALGHEIERAAITKRCGSRVKYVVPHTTPPEFVTAEAGVLVDPHDTRAPTTALKRAAARIAGVLERAAGA